MSVRGNGPGTTRSRHSDWQMVTYGKGNLEMGVCPGCGNTIGLSGVAVRYRVDCPGCGEKLEVVSLRPIDLDYAFDDEDWQDFGDEEGDEDWDEDWKEEEED